VNTRPESAAHRDPATRKIAPSWDGLRGRIQGILESAIFQKAIIALIIVNAVTLGLETSDTAMHLAGSLLILLDKMILAIFVAELLAKAYVYRLRFHKDPWNLFDLTVVTIALLPAVGSLSVLRALRILRVLRLVSAVPSMRRVVDGLLTAIPGIASIIGLLSLVFYIFSVMATKLFGEDFPEWFGSIGASAYSLFQIMTLESWSMGIVRPVMLEFPMAWLFFVPFILVTTFTVLNLFIGIVVEAMQRQHESGDSEARDAIAAESRDERAMILAELRELKGQIAALKRP
jgi:voltage-gated sodium channel